MYGPNYHEQRLALRPWPRHEWHAYVESSAELQGAACLLRLGFQVESPLLPYDCSVH